MLAVGRVRHGSSFGPVRPLAHPAPGICGHLRAARPPLNAVEDGSNHLHEGSARWREARLSARRMTFTGQVARKRLLSDRSRALRIYRADQGASGNPSCRKGAQKSDSGAHGPVICTIESLKPRYLHEGWAQPADGPVICTKARFDARMDPLSTRRKARTRQVAQKRLLSCRSRVLRILRADHGPSGNPSCRKGAQKSHYGAHGPVICTIESLKPRFLHEG